MPGARPTEKVPERPAGTLTIRPPAAVKVTAPRSGRSPGCPPPGRIGPPSIRNLPVTVVVRVTVVVSAPDSTVPVAQPHAASSSTARAAVPAVGRFIVFPPTVMALGRGRSGEGSHGERWLRWVLAGRARQALVCRLSPGFLEQEVAVAPAVFLAEALVDDLQSGRAEPADDPVAAWIVAVTSDVAFDDLPAYRGKPAGCELRERLLDHRLGHFLDRQVKGAARAQGAMQVGQH